jgi:hypothetical protein
MHPLLRLHCRARSIPGDSPFSVSHAGAVHAAVALTCRSHAVRLTCRTCTGYVKSHCQLCVAARSNSHCQWTLTSTLPLQRLRTLRGVGGRLPFGLPHQLETLEYIARAAAPREFYGSREEAAAAGVIAQLGNLVQLTVRLWTAMPLSFISTLPSTLQVAWGFVRHVHIRRV